MVYYQQEAAREAQPAGIVFTHGLIFWGFRLAEVTRCTDQGEIWQGGAALPAKFHLDRQIGSGGGFTAPKTKNGILPNCP